MTNTEPTIEELRQWSAEVLMELKTKNINSFGGREPYYVNVISESPFIVVRSWRPDDPTTGQIWMVVERMMKKKWCFKLEQAGIIIYGEVWIARFTKVKAPTFTLPEGDYGIGNAKDPCLAILKAAYQAWRYKP